MAPQPPPPLPVADNYASLTNRISLSIASRSSILKGMSRSTAAPVRRRALPDDNDDDLTRGTQLPNTGVGYVPEKKDIQKYANSKEERMLRGRMGKGTTGKSKKMVEESESEEEMGRSALGKRKRPRKEAVEPEPELENQTLPAAASANEVKEGGEAEVEADVEMKGGTVQEKSANPEGIIDKKRKRKNKKKKQKQTTENAETEV
ncbi:hypothetical protein FLONG3_6743 [Fusarium longipes]|uniref:Uncharacterized protein n=1 Tax=Fusarium longipes TaxID=694270 RepID=A0A395SKN8_9HYPO|nr:hypothetical protein FLONG3_6743 [Fusarium longipes]